MRGRFLSLYVIVTVLLIALTVYLVDWNRSAPPKPAQTAQKPAPAALPYPSAGPAPAWVAYLQTADARRGREIMQSGLIHKDVQACSSCHGIDGQPVRGSNVPRLSGQSAYYLAKQLADYADGRRRNNMMSYYARLLTGQQRADVAVAWSSRGAPYAAPVNGDSAALARGRDLFAHGDGAEHVQACSNCHWLSRLDAQSSIPYIAGQNPDYTSAALQDWVSGARRNDGGGVMQFIVARLSPADRVAVSAYLATVQPPPGTGS